METQELKSIVEALIFAADEPLSEARLRETLELENGFDFGAVIEGLNEEYQSTGRAFTIRKIAGGYQIVTQQNYASWIKKLYLGRQKNRLSHAALETLALIAFKQPISRVDIAQIRGVNSDGVIGTLLERKLVTISGRSEAVGRPLLYSTTAEFLKYFGINDIADLPKPREIEELFSKEGMPEELLQALSQTDAQLSLPINGDGETPATPDETENKIATAAASILPPVIIETPPTIEAPLETAEIESLETVADSPAETVEIESTEIVADSPAEHIADDADTTPVAVTPMLTPEIPAVDINEEVVTQLEGADKLEVALSSSGPIPAGENEIAWISLNSANGNAAEHFTGNGLAIDDLTETANDLPTFAAVAEVVPDHSVEQPTTNELAIDDLTETANELPTFAGVAEVVAEHSAEQPATNELAIDDLAETANELPTFAGVAEVVAEHSAEQPATNELAIDDLTETANDLPPFAGVPEVVSETLAVEAVGAADAEIEVQVVETYDVGWIEVESLPELQSAAAEEIDGWMAEEFSPEEIAEPDFIKKSVDFFLEEERHDLVAASDTDALAVPKESEPIVVSDSALSSVADEIFLHPAATENNFIAPEEPTLHLPEFLTPAEIPVEAGNVATSSEQSADVTVVDFPEPTIVEIIPDAAPTIVDDIAVSGVLDEAANLTMTFENTLLSAHEELATAEPSANSVVVDFTESPTVESVAATTPTLVEETGASRTSDETADSAAFASAVELRQEVVAVPVFEKKIIVVSVTANVADEAVAAEKVESETIAPPTAIVNFAPASQISPETTATEAMTATTQEASLPKNNDGRPTTLRERVVGWIKRTFNKLMTVIGAAPESE